MDTFKKLLDEFYNGLPADQQEAQNGHLSHEEFELTLLERFYNQVVKPYYEYFDAKLADLHASTGFGHHFQDETGIVYQLTNPAGTYKSVKIPAVRLARTRFEGEAKGDLSLTAARELGYTVEGKAAPPAKTTVAEAIEFQQKHGE